MEDQKVEHLAIIMDGNRRYAKQHKLEAWRGHDKGSEVVDNLVEWCKELGINQLTLYTLSSENLKRNEKELNYLFDLFKKWFLKFKQDKRIHENQVKVRFVGDISLLPKDIQNMAKEMEKDTENYNKFKLNFCLAYGGRLELVNAFNKLKEKQGKITEQDITNALWISDEPDLIIRTGKVIRTSNFLPWQSVYSEWVFLDKLWPEFNKEDLIECVKEFENRKRNFGK